MQRRSVRCTPSRSATAWSAMSCATCDSRTARLSSSSSSSRVRPGSLRTVTDEILIAKILDLLETDSIRGRTMAHSIEAIGLVKNYPGDVRALDELSFSVDEGTVFGLLGPNGAGKSTAVKILTTLARPDSGQARVSGSDVL